MSQIALEDFTGSPLLSFYLDEIAKIGGHIFDVDGKSVGPLGSGQFNPQITVEEFKQASEAPVSIDIAKGKLCGLFGQNEIIGYIAVATPIEDDAAKADFVFQLVNDQISMKIIHDDATFDAAYFKSIISLMQKLFQKLAVVFDATQAAEVFTKECQVLFGAKSGAVFLLENKKLSCVSSFGGNFSDLRVAEYVCFSGKSLVSNEAKQDPLFKRHESEVQVPPPSFDSLLAVPLVSAEKTVGVLQLCDKESGQFWAEDQKMAQTIGTVLGATIENINLHKSLVKNERIKSTLERYLSPNLVHEIIQSGGMQKLGGQKVQATVMFADIRGFTKIAEKISPETLVNQLNEYFEEMSNVIFAFDGTLDKYVGDMIMVLFGVPKSMEDSPTRAVKTAIEMQARLQNLNKKWRAQGKSEFGVGIGINFGDMIFGNIGSSTAMGLTVIGDPVNRAQRLQAFASAGEIIISEAVEAKLQKADLILTSLGEIEIKGTKINAHKVKSK